MLSPVYEAGAGNSRARPWSRGSPFAPRNIVKVATRGCSVLPTSPSTIASRFAPETRTTPIPPRPGGVAIAAIVGLPGVVKGVGDSTRLRAAALLVGTAVRQVQQGG